MYEDRYDLNFSFDKKGKWGLSSDGNTAAEKDTALSINGKAPAVFTPHRGYPIWISFGQTFMIPDDLSDRQIQLSLNNKCRYIENAVMRVMCFDEKENMLFVDSVDINHDKWKKSSLSFAKSKTKFITIEIEILGDTIHLERSDDQKAWFDKLELSVGGRDINTITGTNAAANTPPLDAAYIVPLRDGNLSSCLNGKRVIGLGETIHGSETVTGYIYDVMKEQVEHHNCRLILLEWPVINGLYWNLYIQGKLPENVIGELKKERLPNESFVNFLTWLREYNTAHSEKVQLLGFDDVSRLIGHSINFYREIVLAYVNDETAAELLPLLLLLDEKRYCRERILPYMDKRSAALKAILGDREFELLRYALVQYEDALLSKYIPQRVTGRKYFNVHRRDYAMWLTAKKILDLYARNDDKTIVLMGHYLHLNKLNTGASLLHNRSLGYYLNQHFADDYRVIAVTAGEGNRVCSSGKEQPYFLENLPPAVAGSVEQAGMDAGVERFFYPSSKLPDNISTMRLGGATPISAGIAYMALPQRIDGFVFIRNSIAPPDCLSRLNDNIDTIRSRQRRIRDKQDERFVSVLKKYSFPIPDDYNYYIEKSSAKGWEKSIQGGMSYSSVAFYITQPTTHLDNASIKPACPAEITDAEARKRFFIQFDAILSHHDYNWGKSFSIKDRGQYTYDVYADDDSFMGKINVAKDGEPLYGKDE